MKLLTALCVGALLAGCATSQPTEAQKQQEAKAREAMGAGAGQLENSGAIQDGTMLNPPNSAFSVEL
ncbi:hypothetical protein [Cerasicoccus fimbriatus]|uniref:hypothetical protein n=1 Tax=Cerasicoccus fimbriatus TaxID=3014554 RepID=UPI0022B5703B|nr:hypothetical protein [Cerasicoccus sp. TK19100]